MAKHKKCYIHVFRCEHDVYFRCSITGQIVKMEGDEIRSCPVCGYPIEIQTDEPYPETRTVMQIFSKHLDRWLDVLGSDWNL